MAIDAIIAVDNFAVDFSISIPPRDGGIGNGRGDTCQVDRILVPTPLLTHGLLLEIGREFNLYKINDRLVKEPRGLAGDALGFKICRKYSGYKWSANPEEGVSPSGLRLRIQRIHWSVNPEEGVSQIGLRPQSCIK